MTAPSTTVTHCAFCPGGDTRANGQLIDRSGERRDVCAECVLLIWTWDWPVMRQKIFDYQMRGATRWELFIRGRRARRTAREWTAAVRRLTETSSNYVHRRTP